ncbi:MAG: hypothetical protein AABX24_02090 [Nanoarchaeota archaeon]
MSSLHAIQLLTAAARLARDEKESFSKEDINKKLQDIKYLSSQKKVPRLSLRKDIIHLENQLQGVLGLEERFTRQKDKESITVASLKQQITALKNKIKAVDELDLDKKVDHLSFLLGEHLARGEIAGEVALTEQISAPPVQPEPEPQNYFENEKHEAGIDAGKKMVLLQKRLEALKQELELHRELETKKPKEMHEIEKKIKVFEERLQNYYEHHPEAILHEVGTVEVPAQIEVRHKMLFPKTELKEEEKAEVEEERKESQKELPLPPPPRMGRKE